MTAPTPLALANVLDLLLDAVCVVDRNGRFVAVNAAAERIFGYSPAEMLGRPMIELVHPDDVERTLRAANAVMAGELMTQFENRYVRKDGRSVDIMWSARWSESDQVRIAVARDITERKLAEARRIALYAISELANEAEEFGSLCQHAQDLLAGVLGPVRLQLLRQLPSEAGLSYAFDGESGAPVGTRRSLPATGSLNEVIDQGQALLLNPGESGQDGPAVGYWIGVPWIAPSGPLGALVLRRGASGRPLLQADLELVQFVSNLLATTHERIALQQRLRLAALYDPLTGLPNRALFQDRLSLALARARRHQQRLALLFLDLDRFKQINDQLGHAAGDQVLQQVAARLRTCLRESDSVARLAGDEFVVLMEGNPELDHALARAELVRVAVAEPMQVGDSSLGILPSIGVALFPLHAEDGAGLLTRADQAMYRAKREGGNRIGLPASTRLDSDLERARA